MGATACSRPIRSLCNMQLGELVVNHTTSCLLKPLLLQVKLVYANKSEQDIICRDILDGFAEKHSNFSVYYVVDAAASKDWPGGKPVPANAAPVIDLKALAHCQPLSQALHACKHASWVVMHHAGT